MIDASQTMITMSSQGETGGMSPPQKRHLELHIKTLQEAPRDAEKLKRLLQVKTRQKDEAMYNEDTQRLCYFCCPFVAQCTHRAFEALPAGVNSQPLPGG